MKYRKKPIIVEAEQWFPGKQIDGVHTGYKDVMKCAVKFHFIETLEGPMEVKEGDWIITGVEGEQYPCKDSIFRVTYEPVDGE